MEEKEKTWIQISDEGCIFMDYLLAGFEELDKEIDKENCTIDFISEDAYNTLRNQYIKWLWDKNTIEDIHRRISYIDKQFSSKVKLIKIIRHD